MRHLLLYLHIFGFVLWMGGGFAAMLTAMLMRQLPRTELAVAMQVQARLLNGMILPGVILVVLSGLVMTLRLYGSATSVGGLPVALMVMQGAGLLGAVLVLVLTIPTMTRLSRLDPVGPHAALFDALRGRARIAGFLTGALAMMALVAGVLLR